MRYERSNRELARVIMHSAHAMFAIATLHSQWQLFFMSKRTKVRFHSSGYALNTPDWIRKTIDEAIGK